MSYRLRSILLFIFGLQLFSLNAQQIPAGWTIMEEVARRNALLDTSTSSGYSFLLRPLDLEYMDLMDSTFLVKELVSGGKKKDFSIGLLPLYQNVKFVTGRTYGLNLGAMSRTAGLQSYTSAGIYMKYKFLHLQVQPELISSQNSSFTGFDPQESTRINNLYFSILRRSNQPERPHGGAYSRAFLGNSSLTARIGSIEAGLSTAGLFWGPGQFAGLIFGNAAPSFPYLTLNTFKPAKTFLGNFEFQMISGVIRTYEGLLSQSPELNNISRGEGPGDKYVNALSVTYSPKWIPGLHVGANRIFQESFTTLGNDFISLFPVFMGITKESTSILEEEQVTGQIDPDDQQISVFARYQFKKAKAELYFEYGRRDHNLNWREFILNPEHARAYLFGFNKLFDLPNGEHIQVRSEILQQQESINRSIRYLSGFGASWATHSRQYGFGNLGQNFGSSIGTGSNSQTMEVSWVKGFSKLGLLLERVERNADFFYAVSTFAPVSKPWVDLSGGVIFAHHWQNLIFSGRLQAIRAYNYQWQGSFPSEATLFPASNQNKNSLLGLMNMVYHF
ncbi:capsule assembly Wzi family protein [Mongoliibacter ruber]|uniref:Capsule assembly protein Wzi n=1 Tax=Mongoliibacter ruber TaxID=1750599 RepID=A0A2T0WNT3_9BACT|nr:capsule assembly Wzi family protein [Mongoliibacter ruber]PRY88357.1 capsule assembly protein Wzi [Mongoliibacter ruber]